MGRYWLLLCEEKGWFVGKNWRFSVLFETKGRFSILCEGKRRFSILCKGKGRFSILCEEKIGFCDSMRTVVGILGKGRVCDKEGGKGRCGGVWRWGAFRVSCMRCGMTPVRSIVRVDSLWLGARTFGCWSIVWDMLRCVKWRVCVYAYMRGILRRRVVVDGI